MSQPLFTKGPYFGVGSAIYSDHPQDVDPKQFRGFREMEHGRGYLIAESIPHVPTRDLLVAGPELYDFIATLENDDGKIPGWLWAKREALLASARGERS